MSVNGGRVTIQTVADHAGVSKKTVSRVLNREKGVTPATEDRVMASVKELGFKPNIAARSLAGARSYNIALAYDDPSSEYMAGVQGGVLEICRQFGYHLLLEPLDQQKWPAAGGQDLIGVRHLDGVILMPPLSDQADLVDGIIASGLPVVLISSGLQRDDVLHVRIAEAEAARVMTRHLIELGHRRIAFIVGRQEHGAALRRRKGFIDEMHAQGLDVPDSAIAQGDFTFRSGMQAAEDLLASAYHPTAIFAGNDHMAAGVMAALHKHGLRVPEDISVAGFDGAEIAEMVWPPLTTIHQPLNDLGRAAGDRLDEGHPLRCELTDHQIAEQREATADQRDAGPQAEDIARRAAGRFHADARRERFGDVRQEDCDHRGERHAVAVDQADADDDRFRNAVDDGAERDGAGRAPIAAVAGAGRAHAVAGAGMGKKLRADGEDHRAKQETAGARHQPAGGEGVVHDVEGDGRNQDAGAEGHDPGDFAPAEISEPAERRAEDQRATTQQAPEARGYRVADIHALIAPALWRHVTQMR